MKRLFDNTSFSFIDYIVLVGLNLVATPFLIDNFGVEGYGAYIFLNIFSIYGALAVFDLGMEGSLMNFVARFQAAGEKRNIQSAVTASFVYYAIIGAIVAALIYFGSDLLASRMLGQNSSLDRTMLHNAISLVALNAFVQFLVLPLTATLQGMRRFVITKGLSAAVNTVRYSMLIVAAVVYHRIDIGFAFVLAVTVVRLAVVGHILFRWMPEMSGWRPRFEWGMFRRLFSYSSLLFVNRLVGLIHNESPKGFIWYFLTVATMAVYDVIARPAMLLRTVLGVAVSALVPEVARLHQKNDTAGIAGVYVNLVRYSYMFLCPLLAVMFVYIDDFINVWVGEQFVAQARLGLILLAGFLIVPISAVTNTMVVGLEQVRRTIWIPIGGTIVGLSVSISLVQAWGLPGVLVGTLAYQLFTIYPYARFMKRFLDLDNSLLFKPLVPVFGVAILFAAVNLAFKTVLADRSLALVGIAIVTSLGNYLVTLRCLLRPEERRFLIERWRDIRKGIPGSVGVDGEA